jgi:hypothetical protein
LRFHQAAIQRGNSTQIRSPMDKRLTASLSGKNNQHRNHGRRQRIFQVAHNLCHRFPFPIKRKGTSRTKKVTAATTKIISSDSLQGIFMIQSLPIFLLKLRRNPALRGQQRSDNQQHGRHHKILRAK